MTVVYLLWRLKGEVNLKKRSKLFRTLFFISSLKKKKPGLLMCLKCCVKFFLFFIRNLFFQRCAVCCDTLQGVMLFFCLLWHFHILFVQFVFIFNQLAQLMADLQKLPGGPGLLKKQEGKQKRKERIPVSIVKDLKLKNELLYVCFLPNKNLM